MNAIIAMLIVSHGLLAGACFSSIFKDKEVFALLYTAMNIVTVVASFVLFLSAKKLAKELKDTLRSLEKTLE